MLSYQAAMSQCFEAASPAFWNNVNPTNDTVGTIVNGVMYFKIIPIMPGGTYKVVFSKLVYTSMNDFFFNFNLYE